MKKYIFILAMCLIGFNNSYASNLDLQKNSSDTIEFSGTEFEDISLSSIDYNTLELVSIEHEVIFSCTLSAELSYNGVGIKLSITASNCEKAGAGLAQAVKGFMKEMQ